MEFHDIVLAESEQARNDALDTLEGAEAEMSAAHAAQRRADAVRQPAADRLEQLRRLEDAVFGQSQR